MRLHDYTSLGILLIVKELAQRHLGVSCVCAPNCTTCKSWLGQGKILVKKIKIKIGGRVMIIIKKVEMMGGCPYCIGGA